jgi:hypothetical protein
MLHFKFYRRQVSITGMESLSAVEDFDGVERRIFWRHHFASHTEYVALKSKALRKFHDHYKRFATAC